MTQTNATVHRGFYGLSQKSATEITNTQINSDDSIVDRFFPVIPKVVFRHCLFFFCAAVIFAELHTENRRYIFEGGARERTVRF